MQRVWYVAYGTNLSSARFAAYLRGGRPWGAARHYTGSRDRLDPERDVALTVPGGIRFVGTSSVWGGGLAVYDRDAAGEIPARAYLVTAEQFVDVLAQEMRMSSGLELDLAPAVRTGWHSFGDGSYQTVAVLGTRDGLPLLTFTCSDAGARRLNAPSAGYLLTMARGLRESHRWQPARIGQYLARQPGAGDAWTAEMIEGIAAAEPSGLR